MTSRLARSAMERAPRVYLGTMTFGWDQASTPVTADIATEMVRRAHSIGITYFDSARIYAGGQTEPIVGQCLSTLGLNGDSTIKITTKAHPSQPNGLSREGLSSQLSRSLEAMGITRVDEFYLHQPDTENDLALSLQAAHELIVKGLVGRLGMSNYHEDEVERAMKICQENSWTPPSVYQGLYNPLNRRAELSLLPVLRRHNIEFVAFNALAAGLLTGKHKRITENETNDEVLPGRFKNNPNYLPRFYTSANFDALDILFAALPPGMDLITASYKWLFCHSALQPSDGVLFGASSLPQLESNLAAYQYAINSDPLPAATLAAFDEAWSLIQESNTAFAYWRSYSKDHPNRENLDQGASYNAAKTK
jgi:aflatoxin B1 aldehyde reductase